MSRRGHGPASALLAAHQEEHVTAANDQCEVPMHPAVWHLDHNRAGLVREHGLHCTPSGDVKIWPRLQSLAWM